MLCNIRFYFHFVWSRRCRYVNNLIDTLYKFIELKWSIIECRWQTEPVFYKRFFTRTVTIVHSSNLRHRHMRLVHHDEEIIWEIINQCKRCFPSLTFRHMTGIVFDARAIAHFLHHFYIVTGTLF